ncbi:MAG: winged helix-turn-helix domain-containing protein [Burkholderiales bacterium]
MRRNKTYSPKIRVFVGAAIGPGKADLLEAIEATGSISAAAQAVGMSYARAWSLVDSMNRSFKRTLVNRATGGQGGGGAIVTNAGRDVLRRYREMESKAVASVRSELVEFTKLTKANLGK